jgi:hypothetical protein
MQTRLMSLIEAITNVVVGLIVSLVTQLLVFPLYGIEVSFSANVQIMLIFTVVSIVRSYALRRVFTRIKFGSLLQRD